METVAISAGGIEVSDEESTTAVGDSLVAVTIVNVEAMVGASGCNPAGESRLGTQAHRSRVQNRAARIILIILS